jgi:signal transduction histidine kinase
MIMRQEAFQPSLNSKISHELRIPVSAIVGLIHFLKSTNLDAEQESYIDDLEESANQLLHSEEKICSWIDDQNSKS